MKRAHRLLSWPEAHPTLSLAAIIVLFSGVVLGNITRWSIWFDEAFSAYLVRFGFGDIVRYTAADVHPPLYYWLLKIWTIMFGTSELAFRSLSLLFAVIGLVGVYAIIKRLFRSETWALAAALAVCASPMLVRFSAEVRMYTLVFAIVAWGTYALVRATESNARRWWVLYALLVALGMYTHYFVALAWISHWVWRAYEAKRGRIKQFWTAEWVWTFALAIGLYLPWSAILLKQFATVQAGFWIPPLSAYTPIDYLSNTLLYREYGAVRGWWAIGFYVFASVAVWLAWQIWSRAKTAERSAVALVSIMAVVPPVLLMLGSIPPLKSSFIDRYVLYAQVFFAVIAALGLLRVWAKRPLLGAVLGTTLIVTSVLGIYNVYYYGNYNKNSMTSIRVRDVVRQIDATAKPGEPIIAATQWLYYEAAFYDTRDHHVYFLDQTTSYKYGSEKMLKENDIGKIKDLTAFAERHRYVWYLGSNVAGEVPPPVASWRRVKSVAAYDYIDKNTKYRAGLYDTQAK
ncbi:MAG TPA: glycosyltransferase family 39 protein [Patescibacteria group bacterium]|jgi:uncharacterized membrane protein|nr:glycosyltransferase family 39 protein [Patescibacteria group bacterium]